MKRQIYKTHRAGAISNLKIREDDIGSPGPEEVTIAVMAIGLNFADIFALFGLYSATPKGGFVPGLEYAGVVIDVGSKVKELEKGDKVMGVTRFGGYASHLNIDSQYVIALPEGWSYEEGAAYPVQALTAYYGLVRLGQLRQGETVLIHSAAGGVGILANRIAKHFGAFTIGTVGSERKLQVLEEEGYDKGIVRSKDFDKRLRDVLNGRGLDVVMECIGGKIFRHSYDALSKEGRMIVYGSARYATHGVRPNYLKLIYYYLTRPKIDPQKMIEENKAILGFNLIWLYEQKALMQEVLQGLGQLDIGKPRVEHLFEFEQMLEAIRLFQKGNTVGKVVVKVK